MQQHDVYIVIYVIQSNIHLANLGARPCVFAAVNGYRQFFTLRVYDAPTSSNSIDFVDYVRSQLSFQPDTIRTIAGEMFDKTFTEHLERCGIQHELLISQPQHKAEILVNNALPYKPNYKGMIDKYFAAFDGAPLLRLGQNNATES